MSEDDPAGTRQARDSHGDRLMGGVARDLSELARELDAESDASAVMQRIVIAAVEQIDAATGAAITLLDHGVISSPAHSDDRAGAVGLAQEKVKQGPCVDTSREHVTLRSDDLRADDRWPEWAAEAVRHGVRSALSFQLFVGTDSMGALDVYGDEPHAFDEDAENTGLLLAAHAAIAMSKTRKVTNLHLALASRDVIGQAKGILMERFKIDAMQAFDLLVKASHDGHRKLADVADYLASTGELPEPAHRT